MNRLAWLVIIPLCALAALTGLIWLTLAAMHDPKGKRAWSLAEGFDRVANAAIGGLDEMTISAHAGHRLTDPEPPRWACLLCRLLDRIDPQALPEIINCL